MRVLIVNEEPLTRTALENVVAARSDVGHFDTACNAGDALDKLSKGFYDVLLLDPNMSEHAGTSLLDRLKNTDERVPGVVFVTSLENRATTSFAENSVDCSSKPLSPIRACN